MTYKETLDYIHTVSWRGSRLGLSRTYELLSKIGDPQKGLKFIHVAGTNGKGSVCSMLSYILEASGYKTGLYTSPYIVRFNERMKINNTDISDSELVDIVSYIRPFAEAMEDKPTEFELITALAFEYFRRNKCDVVVLEVGMGGELDSTNVIKDPVLSVITAIGLDHTRELGATISEIARAKGGIIKQGRPVLFYGTESEAETVIKDIAKEKNAALTMPDFSLAENVSSTVDGVTLSYKNNRDVKLPLTGTFQVNNLIMALEAAEIIKHDFPKVTAGSIKAGLARTKWQARFEVASKKPYIILDGAHNPHGITAAAESLRKYFPGKKINLVIGVMRDKDYNKSIGIISPLVNRAYTVTPDNPRALHSDELACAFEEAGISAEPFNCVSDAVRAAYTDTCKGTDVIMAAFGSLYMYCDVKQAVLETIQKSEADK